MARNSSRGTIRNCFYLNECQRRPLLTYAILLNFYEENLLGNGSYPLNSFDFLGSLLINGGMSESLQAYQELVHDNDILASGGLLLRRKRLWEIQVRKRILSERLEQRRLDQLPIGNIFTTGLPQEDTDRYFLLKSLKTSILFSANPCVFCCKNANAKVSTKIEKYLMSPV